MQLNRSANFQSDSTSDAGLRVDENQHGVTEASVGASISAEQEPEGVRNAKQLVAGWRETERYIAELKAKIAQVEREQDQARRERDEEMLSAAKRYDDAVQHLQSVSQTYCERMVKAERERDQAREALRWVKNTYATFDIGLGMYAASGDSVDQTRTWKCLGCTAEYVSKWPEWKVEFAHAPNCKFIEFETLAAVPPSEDAPQEIRDKNEGRGTLADSEHGPLGASSFGEAINSSPLRNERPSELSVAEDAPATPQKEARLKLFAAENGSRMWKAEVLRIAEKLHRLAGTQTVDGYERALEIIAERLKAAEPAAQPTGKEAAPKVGEKGSAS